MIRAKEPFQDWLRGLPNPGDFTLDEVNHDTTAYLLPDYEDDRRRTRLHTRNNHHSSAELPAAWRSREKDRLCDRELRMFRRWFDLEFHSIVLDLVDGPILNIE